MNERKGIVLVDRRAVITVREEEAGKGLFGVTSVAWESWESGCCQLACCSLTRQKKNKFNFRQNVRHVCDLVTVSSGGLGQSWITLTT